jgi:hypothetical protein
MKTAVHPASYRRLLKGESQLCATILADTGPRRCLGTVVHDGRRVATADGKL